MISMFVTYNSDLFYYATTFACFVNICIMADDNHVVDFSDVCLTAVGGWLMACKWSGGFDETVEDKTKAKTKMFNKFLETMNASLTAVVESETKQKSILEPSNEDELAFSASLEKEDSQSSFLKSCFDSDVDYNWVKKDNDTNGFVKTCLENDHTYNCVKCGIKDDEMDLLCVDGEHWQRCLDCFIWKEDYDGAENEDENQLKKINMPVSPRHTDEIFPISHITLLGDNYPDRIRKKTVKSRPRSRSRDREEYCEHDFRKEVRGYDDMYLVCRKCDYETVK